MRIIIDTIPHKNQRYPTVGDWFVEGRNVFILVSDLNNWRMEMAVAFHELREFILCKHLQISQKEVDDFDILFEEIRANYPILKFQEPGDLVDAPYHVPHIKATKAEKDLSDDLGVDWKKYELAINKL